MRFSPRLVLLLAFVSVPVVALRARELEVVRGWPDAAASAVIGQVSGVGCDSNGDVLVFHRGSRPWLNDPAKAGPNPEAGVCRLDGKTGRLLGQWGGGQFLQPHGLFVDHRDHVWLTDVGWHQVFEYDPSGRFLRSWGEKGVGGDDAGHFNRPTDVVVLADGSFYVSDGYVNSRVARFSANGSFQFQWGTKGTGPGEFVIPHGIARDAAGRLYVADRQNDRVQIFTAEGKFLAQWKDRAMGRPYGVRVDAAAGLVYIADGGEQPVAPPNRSGLAVLTLDGKIVTTFGRWGTEPGEFMMAHDIALSRDGSIYVGEINGRRVQKLRWKNSP